MLARRRSWKTLGGGFAPPMTVRVPATSGDPGQRRSPARRTGWGARTLDPGGLPLGGGKTRSGHGLGEVDCPLVVANTAQELGWRSAGPLITSGRSCGREVVRRRRRSRRSAGELGLPAKNSYSARRHPLDASSSSTDRASPPGRSRRTREDAFVAARRRRLRREPRRDPSRRLGGSPGGRSVHVREVPCQATSRGLARRSAINTRGSVDPVSNARPPLARSAAAVSRPRRRPGVRVGADRAPNSRSAARHRGTMCVTDAALLSALADLQYGIVVVRRAESRGCRLCARSPHELVGAVLIRGRRPSNPRPQHHPDGSGRCRGCRPDGAATTLPRLCPRLARSGRGSPSRLMRCGEQDLRDKRLRRGVDPDDLFRRPRVVEKLWR